MDPERERRADFTYRRELAFSDRWELSVYWCFFLFNRGLTQKEAILETNDIEELI